ncbi:MAG: hypothetical protein AVDCRST_MAG59-829 [uncultured Thermomicrobiales bacterium]|uniref:Uncharacterized protein n=1 Tax=uncultured Thermomicrobiales bacterium TaxID=1645740 RepID=A0A6J4U511_9BACT|nr:MAG: hypothetical protein AVDCRST_MAG59-829 [uncultured Thermomicrobiales bacterium]
MPRNPVAAAPDHDDPPLAARRAAWDALWRALLALPRGSVPEDEAGRQDEQVPARTGEAA